ncbi:MAG: hypothetical protein J6Y37_16115 [Paludibacteraceae bacterium]|nr:hypothetical protein [Paludibacteraceae bacterium]
MKKQIKKYLKENLLVFGIGVFGSVLISHFFGGYSRTGSYHPPQSWGEIWDGRWFYIGIFALFVCLGTLRDCYDDWRGRKRNK